MNNTMHPREFSAVHRENLFQTLYDTEERQGGDWDQVFTLMRQGQQAAERAELAELADQFASGRNQVIDDLKRGGQFLDWELEFMQLGMAVGNLSGIYQRIALHYQLMRAFFKDLRKNLRVPLVLLLLVAWGMPAVAVSRGMFSLSQGVGNALLALVPAIILMASLPLLVLSFRSGWLPAGMRDLAYRMPGVGSLMRNYQTYHYLSHFSMCISAGFSLNQALKQSARRMPVSPMKSRFADVARAVDAGTRFSAALERSGILRGIRVPPLPPGTTAQDAQLKLTEAVYKDCIAQSRFWARSLPWLLLALLPFVVTLNAISA